MLKLSSCLLLCWATAGWVCNLAGSPAQIPQSPKPAAETSTYKFGEGPHSVQAVVDIALPDAQRKKDLPLTLYFPREEGPFPVIVFSHGAGGSGRSYFPLTRYWASHGYVLLQPTHEDSLRLGRGGGMRGAVRAALLDAWAWEQRARDVSFLLDSLDELERRVPELKGKMDRQRIGVAGHSLGAQTCQLVGGATVDIPGGTQGKSFADPRVRAILALSGQGRGQMGFTERSWQPVGRPMMSMTGSRDSGARGKSPEWRKDAFDLSPPGDKYFVWIEGATHFSFTGRASMRGAGRGARAGDATRAAPAVDQEAIFGYVKAASLAFWDAYLRQQKEAAAYLRSDALERSSQGAVKLHRK